MRPSKIKTYMDVAQVVAKRSHDAETKVGAVLVNNLTGAIIATGYNGFVRGADDKNLPNTRPDKYEYFLHAEMNLICNCGQHGISLNNCSVICTLTPCKLCMRLLYNSGITFIVAANLYKDFNEILTMKDITVNIKQDENGFYFIEYKKPKQENLFGLTVESTTLIM